MPRGLYNEIFFLHLKHNVVFRVADSLILKTLFILVTSVYQLLRKIQKLSVTKI